jgi:predicted secreted protein
MAIEITTNPLQGEDLLLKVSPDNGETWYTIVCLIKQAIEKTRNVNKTQTQCGQLIGKGVPDVTLPIEGAVNAPVPAVADDEGFASYYLLNKWFHDFTPLMFTQKLPETPANSAAIGVFNEGKCYITDLKMDAPVDNIITFSATLMVYGTVAIDV